MVTLVEVSLVFKLHLVGSKCGVRGITNETELYWTAIGGLLCQRISFAGWFHYHKAAPKLEWFQNVESMMNHHLAGLLGLGCLSWSGHQIHISLPVNKLLDAGVAPQEIPLPHELLLTRLMGNFTQVLRKVYYHSLHLTGVSIQIS